MKRCTALLATALLAAPNAHAQPPVGLCTPEAYESSGQPKKNAPFVELDSTRVSFDYMLLTTATRARTDSVMYFELRVPKFSSDSLGTYEKDTPYCMAKLVGDSTHLRYTLYVRGVTAKGKPNWTKATTFAFPKP